MNLSYLYIDEKSLSYANVLEKVMINGIEGNSDPSHYENFGGYNDKAKSSYYDVNIKI